MTVILINSFVVPPCRFTPAGQRIPGVRPHPGLYEVCVEVKAGQPTW